MRAVEFKASRAVELLGAPIDTRSLPGLCERSHETKGEMKHYRYTPMDLRKARHKLDDPQDGRLIPLNERGLPPIIVTRTIKGGTGKTTVTANLATALAFAGYRVLLIDGDPQGSLSQVMGVDIEDPTLRTLLHLMFGGDRLQDTVKQIYSTATLDVVPADITMSEIDARLNGVPLARERVFDRWVIQNAAHLRDNYDIILVDTNPGSTLLNFNLMMVADLLMGVVSLDGLSLKTMKGLQVNLYELQMLGREPEVTVVANELDPSVKHMRENYSMLEAESGGFLNPVVFPKYAGFGRQIRIGGASMPLIEGEPTAPAAKRFIDLAQWLVQHMQAKFKVQNQVNEKQQALV